MEMTLTRTQTKTLTSTDTEIRVLTDDPFQQIFKRSRPDCTWKMHVKFEVYSFNRFGAISI